MSKEMDLIKQFNLENKNDISEQGDNEILPQKGVSVLFVFPF